MPWWSWSLKYQSLFFLMWRLIFFKKNELVPLDEYFKIVLNFVVQHPCTTPLLTWRSIKLVQFSWNQFQENFRENNFTQFSQSTFYTRGPQPAIASHPLVLMGWIFLSAFPTHTPLWLFFRFRIEFKLTSNRIRIEFLFSSMQTM